MVRMLVEKRESEFYLYIWRPEQRLLWLVGQVQKRNVIRSLTDLLFLFFLYYLFFSRVSLLCSYQENTSTYILSN